MGEQEGEKNQQIQNAMKMSQGKRNLLHFMIITENTQKLDRKRKHPSLHLNLVDTFKGSKLLLTSQQWLNA